MNDDLSILGYPNLRVTCLGSEPEMVEVELDPNSRHRLVSLAMILSEKKIALIPRLVVQRSWGGPKEYAALVTDQRTILLPAKEGMPSVLLSFNGMGVEIGGGKWKTFDYEHLDPSSLAADQKNVTIPHDALNEIQLKKTFLRPAYLLELQYQSSGGKRKRINGELVPPVEYLQEARLEGTDRKEVYLEYAKDAQDVFKDALSPLRFQSLMSGTLL